MTDDEARAFIASVSWTFAKSMPYMPHYWTVVKDAPDAATFHRFVKHLNETGTPRAWGKASNPIRRYLDVDGWRYWTMDRDIRDVTLINRQEVRISKCRPA